MNQSIEHLEHKQVHRLQSLKQTQKGFPIRSLVILYCNAHPKDVYINWMEGFKLLLAYLAPIELGNKTEYYRVPEIFVTYEVQQLAILLGCHWTKIYKIIQEEYESGRIRK